jgi:hypothetical protein
MEPMIPNHQFRVTPDDAALRIREMPGISPVATESITNLTLRHELPAAHQRAKQQRIMTPHSTDRRSHEPRKAPQPRKAQEKKRSWPVRALSWGIPIIAATVIANYTVPGVHRVVATSACLFKYATAPTVTRPAPSTWAAFGSSQISYSASSLAVRPNPAMGAADEWFGASLPVTTSCDYRIDFQATLIGPLYNVPGSGYGYAIGAHGDVDNGVPAATTIQYDPPFGGLRTVDVPAEANSIGYNATPFPGITADTSHRWDIIVTGNTMMASLDGRAYSPVRLDTGDGDQIIVRVWNAAVTITNMSITKLRPRF